MKRIYIIMCLLIFPGAALKSFAQVPRTISYQGVLADGSGNFIPDGSHSLTIKLYEVASGGSAVYEESQSVAVVKGMFNMIIGSVSPIPGSLPFNKAYFLGIAVDGGSELVPRTAISVAPYAMYASVAGVANSLAPGATGVVTSVNAKSGDLTLQGGGGTTITSAGNIITISSTGGGGGTGIQGVQSTDGSIGITNSTGPIADLTIPIGSITTAKLADGGVTIGKIAPGLIPTSLPPSGAAGGDLSGTYPNPSIANNAVTTVKIAANTVTNAKIGSGAATLGQVLTADGVGNTSWTTLILGGLTLPFAGSTNNAGVALSITNSGAGNAVKGIRSATTGTAAAVIGETSSTDASAVGVQGTITSTAPGGFSTAVKGVNNGTGGLGVGVSGSQGGSGWGVYGTAPAGIGVYGLSTSGYGLYGQSTSGISVYGVQPSSGTSSAGHFENTNAANSAATLVANTNGTGFASKFSITNASSTSAVTDVSTNGVGTGVKITLSKTSNSARGVDVLHAGVGPGVFATSAGGNGVWGITSSISAAGVIGDNTFGEAVVGRNRGGNGVGAVVGRNDSSGYGVRGFNTKNGIGVFGQAGVSGGTGIGGKFENVNASNSSAALEAVTSGTGNAAYFHIEHATSSANCLRAITASSSTSSDALEVSAASGNALDGTNNSTSQPTMILNQKGTSNIAIFQTNFVNKARIDNTGKGFFNGGTQNGGADVAEAFDVVGNRASYEPGDVLVIAAGYKRTVEKCSKAYATNVIGVHATKPGVLLTYHDVDADISHLVPMGVVGVLPTKVTSQGGAIKAGDLLVTSSKTGYAMKGDPRKIKTGVVIGKALEDFDGTEGIISVFVNVK